ncbi:MBL fold metallo-hydrolase [Aquabacter sp. CN5-332]|uniref:MBL fold metallo-hydrolase n=1 Tax=Aquabacter sp. CN5-332 TaxID=3156608 RepID=UPI0032B60C87
MSSSSLPPSAPLPLMGAPIPVGAMTVMPLRDGFFPLPIDSFPNIASPVGAAIIEDMGLPPAGPFPTPINAFVVERAGRLAIIDAGMGAGIGAGGGPGLGKVAGALADARFDRAKVEAVLMTHLHIDHAGGTFGEDGTAFFPNAELVVQQKEADFWTDDGMWSRAPSDMDYLFRAARTALAAYAGRVRLVSGAVELWPGLTALPLPGHTPGHAGIWIADGDDSLLVWGDVMHVAAMQFPHPDWLGVVDVDPAMAAETRLRLLDRLASEGTPVTGSHLDMRGRILRAGSAYRMAAA